MNASGFGIIGDKVGVLNFIQDIRLPGEAKPHAYIVSPNTHALLMANGLMTMIRLGRFVGLDDCPVFEAEELPDGLIVALSEAAAQQVRNDLHFGALPADSVGLSEIYNSDVTRKKLPY